MAKVHGRKALPLPPSLEVGLADLGFVRVDTGVKSDPPMWRHKTYPSVKVATITSNIPGDPAVLADWGHGPKRIDVDLLLPIMERQVMNRSNPHRFMEETA